MKKKELIKKTEELIDTINFLQQQLHISERENKELKEEIENLRALAEESSLPDKEEPTAQQTQGFVVREDFENGQDKEVAIETPAPQENITKKVAELEPVILKDEIMEYGSIAIGKVVQSSIKYANIISSSQATNKNELLSLIMGRGEMAKAEIFNIAESSSSAEIKEQLIDSKVSETEDYFKSVAGQI